MEDAFDQQIEVALQHLAALEQGGKDSSDTGEPSDRPASQQTLLAQTLQELSNTLAQLQVTGQELRQRNQKLAFTHQKLKREIKERKHAEEKLAEERNLLRALIDNLPDYVYVKDTRSRFLLTNEAVRRHLRVATENELVGKTDFDFFPPQLAEQYYADEQALIQSGQPLVGREEPIFDLETGASRVALTTKVPFRDSQGKIVGLMGMNRDITELKRTEEALRESEAFNRAVLNSLAAHIAVLDKDGNIIAVNEAWKRFDYEDGDRFPARLGIGANYLTACRRVEGEYAREAQAALAGIQTVLDGSQKRFTLEYSCRTPTENRWFLMHTTPLSSERGGAVVSHVDITERKQFENENIRLFEAVKLQREQLRALTARLAEAQETERKQLTRELHDQVGRNLTALGLNLNIIRRQMPDAFPASGPIQARLDDSLGLVEQTTEYIRDLMTNLRPPVLDDYGIVAALRWYGDRFASRAGLTVTVQGEEPVPRLAAPVENALFRIVQEVLTNVAKHAQATEVMVTVAVDDETARLVVADDGIGFDPATLTEPAERQGWGLITMAERAEAAGGYCQVESRPGQGTRITVEIGR
jgi:PAS domain S-box-containing protein